MGGLENLVEIRQPCFVLDLRDDFDMTSATSLGFSFLSLAMQPKHLLMISFLCSGKLSGFDAISAAIAASYGLRPQAMHGSSPPGSREFRNGGNYVLTDRHCALPNRQTLFGKCVLSRIESWVN